MVSNSANHRLYIVTRGKGISSFTARTYTHAHAYTRSREYGHSLFVRWLNVVRPHAIVINEWMDYAFTCLTISRLLRQKRRHLTKVDQKCAEQYVQCSALWESHWPKNAKPRRQQQWWRRQRPAVHKMPLFSTVGDCASAMRSKCGLHSVWPVPRASLAPLRSVIAQASWWPNS